MRSLSATWPLWPCPPYVDTARGEYDFDKLHEVVQVVVRNLNKIIDVNYYPVPEAKKSNFRHRPIGLGVQGLADAFLALRLPFDSPEAKQLNMQIFETIYHAALTASCELAKEHGPYETYPGLPRLARVSSSTTCGTSRPLTSGTGTALKAKIAEHGVRNSLLVAPMPTASTVPDSGQQRVLRALHLQHLLPPCPGWRVPGRQPLAAQGPRRPGPLVRQHEEPHHCRWRFRPEHPQHPADIKALYKTVWEISQRTILQMAADRGAFIDQSQSLNIHMKEPTMGKITSMHFAGWKLGLKTGMYYLRTRPPPLLSSSPSTRKLSRLPTPTLLPSSP